ncbi:uncharacterized protein K441DRAFT_175999 [Cenococcum geophilum 1.58]|uniref:uncharacterized protein n=1 Tax=Cenococcum geophilum 1.58 TaxID=794803 RepID=UPI00358FFF52|nr:hypothetical protein K441DRAFT_175999 [Cenococcum geophilum 1.58]
MTLRPVQKFKSSHVITTCLLISHGKCYPSLLFTSYTSLLTRRRTGLEQGWVWSEQRRTFIRFDSIRLLFRPRSHGLFLQSFPLCIPCLQNFPILSFVVSTFLPHPNPPSRFFSFWECKGWEWDDTTVCVRRSNVLVFGVLSVQLIRLDIVVSSLSVRPPVGMMVM